MGRRLRTRSENLERADRVLALAVVLRRYTLIGARLNERFGELSRDRYVDSSRRKTRIIPMDRDRRGGREKEDENNRAHAAKDEREKPNEREKRVLA